MNRITSKVFKPQLAVTRRLITNRDEIGIDLPHAFSLLFDTIGHQIKLVSGPVFALFHDVDYHPERIDVEACIPLSGEIDLPENMTLRVIEPQSAALSITHIGAIEQVGSTYRELKDYAKQNYHRLISPVREIYIDYSSEKTITEIAWPIDIG